MPKGIPLTPDELARRRKQIAAAAMELFYAHGFSETSMRQIAEAAEVGKSTLYDYFPTKEDILIFLAEEEINANLHKAEKIAFSNSSNTTAYEKLRKIMHMHLAYMVENKNLYLKLAVELQRLSAQGQRRIQVRRYAYQDLLSSLVEQGINEGVFRPVTPLLAARALLNILTPVVFTSRPTGSPQEMLDELFDLLMDGIRK
jgi:AcrR family transcriptional regulator